MKKKTDSAVATVTPQENERKHVSSNSKGDFFSNPQLPPPAPKKKQKTGSNKEAVEEQEKAKETQLKEIAGEVLSIQTEIEAADAESMNFGQKSVELVIKAGTKLLEAQAIIAKTRNWKKKGLWGKWVEENIKGITQRTCSNYMRSAFQAQRRARFIEKGRTDFIPLVDECKSIREMYRAVGIIKKSKPNTGTTTDAQKEKNVEKLKKDSPDEYQKKLTEAAGKIKQSVLDMIKDEKSASWDLSKWKLSDKDVPKAPNEATSKLFQGLSYFIVCNFDRYGLTRDDEQFYKAQAVVSGIVKMFLTHTSFGTTVFDKKMRNTPVELEKGTTQPQMALTE